MFNMHSVHCHICCHGSASLELCQWLLLVQCEILHIILLHTAVSSHCLCRLPPAGDEFPQLAPALCSEIIPQHKPPAWNTVLVNPPFLTDRFCIDDCEQLVCQLMNMENPATMPISSTSIYGHYMPCKITFGMPLIV